MSFLLSLMVFLAAPVTPPASSAEEADKTTILVAYYSETGNTESLAKAIVEGISSVPSNGLPRWPKGRPLFGTEGINCSALVLCGRVRVLLEHPFVSFDSHSQVHERFVIAIGKSGA